MQRWLDSYSVDQTLDFTFVPPRTGRAGLPCHGDNGLFQGWLISRAFQSAGAAIIKGS